ncbi:hypothetical protein Pint_24898 [Pistacia integerrima]|uniref:Uncharacterized protein n=1 Tax=Pistacia integerrima TaxID=434235 RepID=A0ACC0YCJ8_9ROSI|nr:hypothetical protein Pint_24898 [Pistacia integerrima]
MRSPPGELHHKRYDIYGDLAQDFVSTGSANGFNPCRAVSVPNLLFVCRPHYLLGGHAKGDPPVEYFIGVTSIKVNGEAVPLNASLLTLTVKMASFTRVASVVPFGARFSSKGIGSTRVGPVVPQVDLLQNKNVYWAIFGANSMVKVSDDVLSLGLLMEG